MAGSVSAHLLGWQPFDATREGIQRAGSELDPALRKAVAAQMAVIDSRAGDAVAIGDLGALYELHGRRDLAQQCFEGAAAADPSSPRWHFHWAVLAYHAGNHNRAEEVMRRVIALDPQWVSARERLGHWLLGRDEYGESAEFFQQVIDQAPRQAPGYVGLARARLGQGRATDAVMLLKKALEINPESKLAHFTLGRAYQRLNRSVDARREYQLGANAAPEFLFNPWLERRDIAAVTPVAKQQQAAAHIQGRRFAEAVAILEPLHADAPDDLGVTNNLGLCYISLRRFQEARRVLGDAIESGRMTYETYANLGIAHLELGQHDQALASIDSALDLAPQAAWLYFLRGRVFTAVRRKEDAAQSYRAAAGLGYRNPEVYTRLAGTLMELKRPAEALKPWQEAVNLMPKSHDIRFNLAITYGQLGKLDRAAEELRICIQLNPGHERARRVLYETERAMSRN
ncbi:MAG: tetratricopeptide repeat protein [Planctomycetota bacterium]|jgi:tetratricopeptide (TPR) repeat protein